ncbi:Lead, cadmium, zinc and mercury transporting ATPase, Copper-translocating P-type ATPase [Rubellimicrobium mesophilum DSM 19309]|uniref:P-type Zn(2+) transporter n=1 Tax=Rubellimicrobium mesophilum DSM 19309 TaxID=442562 RepID=A0A017HIQ9_9RHOB|nr:Lead, cadmium, zinc and mercury transporting ATPase, Copper-translocating P-type ATPase [Rubellimicrobium mesophilum DSM 19309]
MLPNDAPDERVGAELDAPELRVRAGRADVSRLILLMLAAGGLAVGLALRVWGMSNGAALAWSGATLIVLGALLVQIVGSLRRGDLGLDIVAALSMSAALLLGETLAAAVVALMYAGGQHLERFAEGCARREMMALLAQAPRKALRYGEGALEEVPVAAIGPGDRLLVQRGAVVPVDGKVAMGEALLDEAALTGEALPVRHPTGDEVMSGALNAGDPFDLNALRPAGESTFAGIVRLVEEAQEARAPMVRLADRYAVGFLFLTVLLAGAAWGFSGDPVRAVAVLVVATPCPLILTVPVALVAGLSRAARLGVLVKGGGSLEALARVEVLVIDKTGTLTEGRPRLARTVAAPGFGEEEVLRLAASLDQASQHPVARAVVAEARARGLALATPRCVTEMAGEGMEAIIEGRKVRIGSRAYVGLGMEEADPPSASGAASVLVRVDGLPAGELVLTDAARPEAREVLVALRAEGLRRIVLATGDREEVAQAVAGGLGLDAMHAGLTPEAKLRVVREERLRGPVLMLGDGVNDAPALAAADLGVAMGARGSAASAEAAGIVILPDRLDPLLAGRRIARRALRIARQSVAAGLGLSVLGMVAAAFGLLAPVEGALLQEVIDVAVILNALRVLRPGSVDSGSALRATGDLPGLTVPAPGTAP